MYREPISIITNNLDLRYLVPDRIEEVSNGLVQDNGYDYLENNALGLWLKTESAISTYPMIIKLFREEKIIENDLSLSAEIYISEKDTDELENCRLVFP